jgi:uncharacterized membrane protein YbhN (UPF0104 family)
VDSHLYLGVDEEVMERFPYRKVLKWVIVLAIFIFLGKMVWENWGQVKEASFTIRPFPLLLSALIFGFSYFIQIWAWYLITLKLGIALTGWETLESWFYSQLGKYLPGKVWLILSRFYFYESKGKSKKVISVALYIETVTILLAATFLFLILLLFFKEAETYHLAGGIGWIVGCLILGFIFLNPTVLQRILNCILNLFGKEPISLSISYFDLMIILLICILSWLVGGIGFSIFIDSFFPIPPQHFLFLTGALAISSTLGLIALFAPSGLGVREGALVYLLSSLMPGAVAVIISILTRLWITLIEMGLIGVIYLFGKFQKAQGEREENV